MGSFLSKRIWIVDPLVVLQRCASTRNLLKKYCKIFLKIADTSHIIIMKYFKKLEALAHPQRKGRSMAAFVFKRNPF